MRRTASVFAILLITVLLVGSLAFSQGRGEARGRGVLGVLSKGQPVTLKSVGSRYEIGIIANGPDALGHKVIEVGSDYVVLEDIAGVTESRIPIYAIRAVTTLKAIQPRNQPVRENGE